jgi:hypothetical protein
MIPPDHGEFSGFVFKMQANLDPKHRDRLAYVCIVLGAYHKGMKVSGHASRLQFSRWMNVLIIFFPLMQLLSFLQRLVIRVRSPARSTTSRRCKRCSGPIGNPLRLRIRETSSASTISETFPLGMFVVFLSFIVTLLCQANPLTNDESMHCCVTYPSLSPYGQTE